MDWIESASQQYNIYGKYPTFSDIHQKGLLNTSRDGYIQTCFSWQRNVFWTHALADATHLLRFLDGVFLTKNHPTSPLTLSIPISITKTNKD